MRTYTTDNNTYEFIETRRGRELLFQNYSYTRFGSSLFHCSSRKSRLCDARVVLDDSKLVIISAVHNHLPPFLTRNEDGTVSCYLNKSQTRQRREKATLGPRATRYEVDCLVASIMQEMETNRKQTTEEPVEAEAAPNNYRVTRKIVVRRLSSEAKVPASGVGIPVSQVEASTTEGKTLVNPNEGLPTNKIDINSSTEKTHQNEFASYVYQSAANRTRALTKLMASTLGSEPRSPQTSVGKTFVVRQEPDNVESSDQQTVEDNPIVPPATVDVPIKREPGLLTNQMYIVLPPANADADKVRQTRFIIPSPQNTGNILYNNKIILSPVKTEANTETSVVQEKKNEPYSLTGNIHSKDGNAATLNKMFIVVRTNDSGSSLQNNQNMTKMTDKVPNKMFILVHNKKENDAVVAPATDALAQPNQNTVSSDIISPTDTTSLNDIQREKLMTQKSLLKTSIPISSIKNLILPPKSDIGSVVISKNPMPSEKLDRISVASPSKINSFPPKVLTLSSNTNITSALETDNQLQMRGKMGSFIPRLPVTISKRTEPVNMMCKKSESIIPMIMTVAQTLPSDLIIDDKNMPLNQMNNNEPTISSGSCKTSGNGGQIQQAINVETKVSSMLPFKSPSKAQNTYGIQNSTQLPVTKSMEVDSPGCSKQQIIVVVKTEPGTLEVSNTLQTNVSNKTETEFQYFKQEIETGTISSETEQYTVSKQQLIIPDDKAEIIHSFSSSKQPIFSTDTEDSMEIHIAPMIKNEIINVSNDTEVTATDKNQSETPGHIKSHDDLSLSQNVELLSSTTIKAKEPPMKLDLDWIVPRNKDDMQNKRNTNVVSKNLMQTTDNTLDFGMTSNIPEIPIPVSMIPLPNESSQLVSTNSTVPKTVGNNEKGLVSVGTPVVMIERLSMKRKADRPSMYGLPPKKRHYQP